MATARSPSRRAARSQTAVCPASTPPRTIPARTGPRRPPASPASAGFVGEIGGEGAGDNIHAWVDECGWSSISMAIIFAVFRLTYVEDAHDAKCASSGRTGWLSHLLKKKKLAGVTLGGSTSRPIAVEQTKTDLTTRAATCMHGRLPARAGTRKQHSLARTKSTWCRCTFVSTSVKSGTTADRVEAGTAIAKICTRNPCLSL